MPSFAMSNVVLLTARLHFVFTGVFPRTAPTMAAAAEWSPPGQVGQAILAASPVKCEDLFEEAVSDTAPALLHDAATLEQRSNFRNLTWLVQNYGKTELQVAHPSYHVLSEGNVETTQPLADFVTDMAHQTSANFSFAFDHVAGIGADLHFKGTPSSAKDAETVKRVFSLGGDGAGLGLHAHGETFLVLLHGQKLWFIAPPDAQLDPAVHDPVHAQGIRLKRIVDSMEAAAQEATCEGGAGDACQSTRSTSTIASPLLQCLQEPGTALYLPKNWLHATVNVGDAVAFALQGDPFSSEEDIDLQSLLHSGSEPQLASKLMLLLTGGKLDEALAVARRMIELEPRDLRPHFYIAEILSGTGAATDALAQMETARKTALALAEADPPAPQELVAVWLLRIAFTFCGPLQSIERGAGVLEQALTYDPRALLGHQLAPILEDCREMAEA